MAYGVRAIFEPLRSLAFGSIGASYTAIGTALLGPARIFKIDNLTNAALLFSIDGATDHTIVPANGFLLVDVATNKEDTQGFEIATGTTFYVKESGVPTDGSVYVTVIKGYN